MLTLHLKQIRIDTGLTQEQLADLAGVSRQTIISLERGTYQPSLDLAFRLAHVLSVPIIKLVEWKA